MDKSDVIECVNSLIETCKDGEYGFRSCSEHARNPELKQIFSKRANGCNAAALELQGLVFDHLGGVPEVDGSARGALHRGWVAVKGTLAGYSDLMLLEECERGEDIAKERYLSALEQNLPRAVSVVVERQFEGVKLNHAQMRRLREAEREPHA